MPIRELHYRLANLGFRVEEIVLATTLLDAIAHRWDEPEIKSDRLSPHTSESVPSPLGGTTLPGGARCPKGG